MPWSGRITLMIMINAMVLAHSLREEPNRRLAWIVSSLRESGSQREDNSIRHVKSKNDRRSKHRMKCGRNLNLEFINTTLKNLFDRYDSELEELKATYAWVKPCVPDKCGKTQQVPVHMLPKKFVCAKLKRCKRLEKKVLCILSRFHAGVKYFAELFENLLVSLHKKKRERSGSRLRILKGFKQDLKALKEETEDVVSTIERLKCSRQPKSLATPLSKASTTYHTDQLVNEWLTFQQLMKFLGVWQKSFSSVFTCWKKMHPRFRKKNLIA